MNRLLIYFSSGFGLFLSLASILNIYKNTATKVMLLWLSFGILAQLVHLMMHYVRINGKKIGNSNLLVICTISQISVMLLYIKTRYYFKNFRFISDFAMIQIATIMIARIVVLFTEGNLYYDME